MKSNSLNSLRGVLEKCDFTATRKVVDVGGGFGHLVVALLEKYRGLRGVLLDMPDLVPVARKKFPVSDPQVRSRLEYAAADMFESVRAPTLTSSSTSFMTGMTSTAFVSCAIAMKIWRATENCFAWIR